MRAIISAALLCAVLACPAAEADFIDIVDTPTLLTGSFFVEGRDSADVPLPATAWLLLYGLGGLGLMRRTGTRA